MGMKVEQEQGKVFPNYLRIATVGFPLGPLGIKAQPCCFLLNAIVATASYSRVRNKHTGTLIDF